VSETIVVLSDVHGNARALRRAMQLAGLGRADRIVILGDLLTYGIDVAEVLDIAGQLRDAGAVVIRGNHDQLYLDVAAGNRHYVEGLPDWLRESIDYTLERLDVPAFGRAFDWRDEFTAGSVLFSHANPFGEGDWRYLASDSDREAAAQGLASRGFRTGVFGHTHRANLYAASGGAGTMVATAGSVGQPRDRGRVSSFLRVRVEDAGADVELVPIDYDFRAHVAALQGSSMSPATKTRLCEFFVPG
jgi:predicted phosphodiesterase